MKTAYSYILACFVALAAAESAQGAALFPNHTVFSGSSVNVAATLQSAARWSSVSGLSDGIQVAVMPGFAEALGAAGAAQVALIEGAVVSAFSAWANPALQFQVTFDGAAVESPLAGFEVDLFAVPSSHPVFVGNSFFGVAYINDQFSANRPLTNGQAFDGYAITGADVYVATDRVQQFAQQFGLSQEQQIVALQRLLMHEIGHGLGLDHPNENAPRNFDSDNDPLNPMPIDGANPFAGVIVSTVVNSDAIMSNQASIPALFFTSLTNDDRAGRDLLYPVVPEPSTFALAVLGLIGLAAWGWRRKR